MSDPGDERQFRDLFDRHYAALAAYADRRCQPGDADDVVAETFAVAWRRMGDLPTDNALPWLYGVARKVLANQRRGRRRWLGLLSRLQSEAGPAPWNRFETAPPVIEALRQLPPGDREILLLAAWEGLGHAEIGAAMGISTNAVAIRVHRARKRLADELERIGAPVRKKPAAAGQSGL